MIRRTISILSALSKIIEKHITKHLFAYLNKYSLLHKSQSGFRKHHSCNIALIHLTDRWLNCIDKGDIIGAVFFDLRKAFDVVDHKLLLQKRINLIPLLKAGYGHILRTENSIS